MPLIESIKSTKQFLNILWMCIYLQNFCWYNIFALIWIVRLENLRNQLNLHIALFKCQVMRLSGQLHLLITNLCMPSRGHSFTPPNTLSLSLCLSAVHLSRSAGVLAYPRAVRTVGQFGLHSEELQQLQSALQNIFKQMSHLNAIYVFHVGELHWRNAAADADAAAASSSAAAATGQKVFGN